MIFTAVEVMTAHHCLLLLLCGGQTRTSSDVLIVAFVHIWPQNTNMATKHEWYSFFFWHMLTGHDIWAAALCGPFALLQFPFYVVMFLGVSEAGQARCGGERSHGSTSHSVPWSRNNLPKKSLYSIHDASVRKNKD